VHKIFKIIPKRKTVSS